MEPEIMQGMTPFFVEGDHPEQGEFTSRLMISNDTLRVIEAGPVLRYMEGWYLINVLEWCSQKKYRIRIYSEE